MSSCSYLFWWPPGSEFLEHKQRTYVHIVNWHQSGARKISNAKNVIATYLKKGRGNCLIELLPLFLIACRSARWRIVGLPCGQFQGDLNPVRFLSIWSAKAKGHVTGMLIFQWAVTLQGERIKYTSEKIEMMFKDHRSSSRS